jgi:hypothetical protein
MSVRWKAVWLARPCRGKGLAMAKGQRRDVRSKDGSGWDVTKPGSKQPVSHHQTQPNAAKAAKGDLKRGSGCEVAVHGRDGRVRNKDTVPRKIGIITSGRMCTTWRNGAISGPTPDPGAVRFAAARAASHPAHHVKDGLLPLE